MGRPSARARRDVLLITVFPVIVGLAANQAGGVASGFLPVGMVAPIWALQLGLAALFLTSWRRAHQAAAREENPSAP
jgi:hypothetical protein